MKNLLTFLLFWSIIWTYTYAQIEIDPKDLDQQFNDESTNLSLTNELREEESNTPIYLKSAESLEMDDLQKLNFLTESDRQRILDYLSKHKPMLSLLELQSIQGMDPEKVRKLSLRIHVLDHDHQWDAKDLVHSKYFGRLSLRWAKTIPHHENIDLPDSNTSAFLGTADKLFARFKFAIPGKISLGLIAEKDEGEQWWTKTSPSGVDYLSAHLSIENINRKIKNVIFGDFRMRIGQGIILDNSFISSSFLDLGYLVKSPNFLKPYQSLQENNMLRGGAATIQLGSKTLVNLFVSKSSVDANTTKDSTLNVENNQELISSIQNSGYHRTRSEIADRNTLVVEYEGAEVKHSFVGGYLGYGLVHSWQNKTLLNSEVPYQLFYSKDNSTWYGTIFHQYSVLGALLYGELASDEKRHFATIQGLLKSFGKYADMALVYRNFDPAFQSRMSQVFSSSGKSQNEKGLYAGFNFSITKEFRVNFAWNTWQHPWLKYRVDLPSTSKELSSRFSFARKRKWLCYLQYSLRSKEQNASTSTETRLDVLENHSFRAHAEIKLNQDFTWRARAEMHQFTTSNSTERGYLLFQDILYKSLESRISGNLRFGFVKTDSYNSRIYAFENEMLYQFKIPAYYGTGLLSYLNLRVRCTRKLLTELRFSIFYRDQTNSELNLYDKEIKFQIHYSFQ